MDNITKDTYVFCEQYNYFGCVQGLAEFVEDIGELEESSIVRVCLANPEPFVTVDDEFIISMINREIEHQGCDNERSSESGDEMQKVEEIIMKHMKIDYEALMKEMPVLYYSDGVEFEIDLNKISYE